MSFVLRYLTPDEKAELDAVCTTREEADQIYARCTALLKAVEAGEYGSTAIGCPHCTEDYACSSCAYAGLPDFPIAHPCVYVEFGGATLDQLGCLWFAYNGAGYEPPISIKMKTPEHKAAYRAFLEAHREWALCLTPSPISWRKMTTEQKAEWREQHPIQPVEEV